MEFKFNPSNVTNDVLKIDNTLTAEGHEKNVDKHFLANIENAKCYKCGSGMNLYARTDRGKKRRVLRCKRKGCQTTQSISLKNKMAFIIDEIGKMSARAQEHNSPVTSADKLINSNHILYMLIENNTPEHFVVIGILKMGWKKLYLYNKEGSRSEEIVNCLLDFYIHESKQRKGYGKRLIEYMLQDMHLHVNCLAIDNPTTKLCQFMKKHFQLSKLVNQGNNFMIYEDFFDDAFDEEKQDNSGYRASYKAKNCGPTYGRHNAHKHRDTIGEIVQGQGHYNDSFVKYHDEKHVGHSQIKEENSHAQSAGSFKTDKDGNCETRS